MPLTPDQIELALEGLRFLSSLHGTVSRNAIESALDEPILLPSLPELPSWLTVQEYVEGHPEFLNTARLKAVWKKRDRDPSYQMALIGEFMRRLQGETSRKVYAFAPSVKRDPVVKAVLSETADEAAAILNNTSWGKAQKKKVLRKLLSTAEIPDETPAPRR